MSPKERATRDDDGRARPLFGLGATLGIAVVLAAPFAILTLTGEEPYPAVIFPGGGQIQTHVVDGVAAFQSDTLVAYTPAGVERVVDRALLLDPIPPSQLSGLIASRFGQDRSSTRSVVVRGIDLVFEVPRAVPTVEETTRAREWLAGQLRSMGLSEETLIVRKERVTIDHRTGRELDREVLEEVNLIG